LLQYHVYGILRAVRCFVISSFDNQPGINNGQLIKIIRDRYLVDAKGYNKIMGVPITKTELVMKLEEMLGRAN
jgi:2-oxoglutarate ferredoxin oxidoreductase subunit alpha